MKRWGWIENIKLNLYYMNCLRRLPPPDKNPIQTHKKTRPKHTKLQVNNLHLTEPLKCLL